MWPKWAKKIKNANPEMIKTQNYEGPIQKGAGTEGWGGGGGWRTHSKSGQDVGAGPNTDSNEALQAAGKHAGRLLAA